MALKTLIDRYKKRRRDAGAGLVDAVVGVGLAAIIVGGPILYFTTMNNAAAGNASTQEQNTAISEALDRAVANIQASDTIKYAAPNELVTASTEVEAGKADNPVITRWVVNSGKLYQQVWSGDAGVAAYDRSSLPTAAAGTANLDTRVSVENLQLDGDLFTYTDRDGAILDVKAPKAALTENARTNPADGKKTYDIALVNIDLKAGTTSNGGKTGVVENKTSAAPRSVSGKADTAAPSAACAAVRVDTNAAGKPVITWSTLPGYTSYAVFRNATQVGTVTAAASDAQKSFTDATVTPGPVEVINYRVQPRNADGTLGANACTPKPWSPQIAAPAFKNSTVLPSADEAHEWTDGTDGALGLKKPRITLKWDAVPGASSYDLKYRELDPVSGNPLTTAFNSAAAGLPAATTTFTWDEGGWGARYEWFIKANAGAGQGQSADSAHITTLTHPAAPQNVNVTPQYGTGSDRLTKGINVITWSASPTAIEYDIWRYNSGSAGAVTKLGTVPASSPLTYRDIVPYGTTWTYYVAAVNDGPRGTASGKASSANPEAGVTAATGTMPTVTYQEPATGVVTSTAVYRGGALAAVRAAISQPNVKPAPRPVTQLQFPPIPSISTVSAAAGQTRDLDGANQVVWAPTLSATGYLPARVTPMTSAVTCLAGDCQAGTGGLTKTSLTDPAAKGTQFDYYVKAVNPTGVSVDFSAKVRLTQRPATPVLKTTKAPDLSTSGATFASTADADGGNDRANKFCTSATCKYVLSRNGTPVSTLDQPAAGSGSPLTWTTSSNPEGETVTFSARAKNEAVTNGGYSDVATTTVNTYPGDFGVNQWLGTPPARAGSASWQT
ncbi:fibronectin type III [Paenarthrobacter sp. C1]|uniref:fibronectin type III n=1 Tax=Paenarthrobacter sp. C1 TaxID=3400220 RepID=UPI003BF5B6A1